MNQLDRLLGIMARLREPGGCPWDREQTRASLRTYVLEEAFEVADAIDGGNWDELAEELGDLLLQVVFLSRLGEEAGKFGFDEVACGIADKLVRRHPHVFGEDKAETPEDVWRHWDAIKQAEKTAGDGQPESRLAGVPRHLPSLVKAHRLAEKAARAGFTWPNSAGVIDKIAEETDELRETLAEGDRERCEEELGDLLFATASLARNLELDPEAALARANRKFIARFQHVERQAMARQLRLEQLEPAELDQMWDAAKDACP